VSDASGEPALTLPQLLSRNATLRGEQVALQEKRYGVWQTTSWADYHTRVRRLAHGLAELGFERGGVLAILGDNRPEWVISELAAQSLGGISVGLYPDGVVEEVEHVLDHAQVRIVVAEDQEQVDKLLSLRRQGRIEGVERIVYYDPRGLEPYEEESLIEFAQLERCGEQREAERRAWLDERIEAGVVDDVAILCTTSGTTAKPKLAMLTHRNLLSMGLGLLEVDPIDARDEFVSFLPLAWIGEQMTAIACSLQAGFALSFPEDASTVQADLREIGPRMMFSPPRIWESLVSSVQVRLDDAGWLKRTSFRWGFKIGQRAAEARLSGRRLGLRLRLAHSLAESVALRPVREQLGLTRIRRAYTGGAPLGPDVFAFLHAIGVNLKQIYGQTEICGIAVLHRDGDIRFNTVGTPLPLTDLEIEPSGEILLRSPAVFMGYYRNEEATAEVLAGGWLHTGDAGYLEDGHLVVVDRAKDVMKARDGTPFSPAFVESKLKFSPFVKEAVVFGEGRPYVTAMVSIDMDNIGTWAERKRLGYTTYTDLAQKPQVYELIGAVIARANDDLPEAVRVHRFVLLHKELDADDAELTRTRKVRRGTINERYGKIIAALYDQGSDSVTVTSVVTYQDGSTAERTLDLRIQDTNGVAVPSLPPSDPASIEA
jgi:long-chain acyl-CoA synthetase